ncbi:hypothetical protein Tsubulata_006838 [Turnera subulata]|uniref:Uncharacterized protein n=1 Tax=Turnera subulata TaxID=218843 RepID=A0A9Q0J2S7_9ROSI|nr:hypothetical protein Tsubulata_006838 [Turnera subulata]
MGLRLVRNLALLFLLITVAFPSTSLAGRSSEFLNKQAEGVDATTTFKEDVASKPSQDDEVTSDIHERVLRANTRDYGNYNPSPALVRPPFKLIPN